MSGTAGVVVLSRSRGRVELGGVWQTGGCVLGLTAGALFGISAIGYRGATLEVASDSALVRATTALAAVTLFQSLVDGGLACLARTRRGGRASPGPGDRRCWWGSPGLLGSLGWFVAFSLMNAAYVRSLGQVELIFSLAASVLVFRERVTSRELAGIALIAAGVIGVVSAA